MSERRDRCLLPRTPAKLGWNRLRLCCVQLSTDEVREAAIEAGFDPDDPAVVAAVVRVRLVLARHVCSSGRRDDLCSMSNDVASVRRSRCAAMSTHLPVRGQRALRQTGGHGVG